MLRPPGCQNWTIKQLKEELNKKCGTNSGYKAELCFARAVVKVHKFCHVTPILKFLHWLKINERIEYKRLYPQSSYRCSITYLHSLISGQPLVFVLLALHLLSPSIDHLHILL